MLDQTKLLVLLLTNVIMLVLATQLLELALTLKNLTLPLVMIPIPVLCQIAVSMVLVPLIAL